MGCPLFPHQNLGDSNRYGKNLGGSVANIYLGKVTEAFKKIPSSFGAVVGKPGRGGSKLPPTYNTRVNRTTVTAMYKCTDKIQGDKTIKLSKYHSYLATWSKPEEGLIQREQAAGPRSSRCFQVGMIGTVNPAMYMIWCAVSVVCRLSINPL